MVKLYLAFFYSWCVSVCNKCSAKLDFIELMLVDMLFESWMNVRWVCLIYNNQNVLLYICFKLYCFEYGLNNLFIKLNVLLYVL